MYVFYLIGYFITVSIIELIPNGLETSSILFAIFLVSCFGLVIGFFGILPIVFWRLLSKKPFNLILFLILIFMAVLPSIMLVVESDFSYLRSEAQKSSGKYYIDTSGGIGGPSIEVLFYGD